jgi:hypothetical protein
MRSLPRQRRLGCHSVHIIASLLAHAVSWRYPRSIRAIDRSQFSQASITSNLIHSTASRSTKPPRATPLYRPLRTSLPRRRSRGSRKMITGTRRWLRRNRTNFAIGAGVLGAGYMAGQYVLGKISEARQRMSDERIAKEKYAVPTHCRRVPLPIACI